MYTTQWSAKWGKKCFYSLSNSYGRHASLSNDITHQKTWFNWFLKSHDKRSLFPYIVPCITFSLEHFKFFCIHNNLAPPLYKAAALSASCLHSADSLPINWAIWEPKTQVKLILITTLNFCKRQNSQTAVRVSCFSCNVLFKT